MGLGERVGESHQLEGIWREEGPALSISRSVAVVVMVASITILGFALRLYKLGEWSYWIDEVITVKAALGHLQRTGFTILMLKPVLRILGNEPSIARLIPALLGAATVPVLYLSGRRLIDSTAGLLAALLLALSPWHIYLSQNARYYGLFGLLTLLCGISFFYGLERDDRRYLVASLGLLALATIERKTALFLIPVAVAYVVLVWALPFRSPRGLHRRNILPLAGLFASVAVLLLVDVGFHREDSLLLQFMAQFFRHFYGEQIVSPHWLPMIFAQQVGYPLYLMAALGAAALLVRKSRLGLFLAIVGWLPLMLLVILAFEFRAETRYIMSSLPFLALLAAVGVIELFHLAKKNSNVIVLAAVALFIVLLKDPLMDDVVHHLGAFTILVMVSGLSTVLFIMIHRQPFTLLNTETASGGRNITLAVRRNHHTGGRRLVRSAGSWGLIVFTIGLLMPLLGHPALTDYLYYERHFGYRPNWQGLASVLAANRLPGELVLGHNSAIPIGRYHIGDDMTVIPDSIAALRDIPGRIWIVETSSPGIFQTAEFAEWASEYCNEYANQDYFITGRNWKMRLLACTSTSARTAY